MPQRHTIGWLDELETVENAIAISEVQCDTNWNENDL